jgi:glutaredoxin
VVTVYGADWCEDTKRSRRLLRRLGVRYMYQNVDRDPAALERAKSLNGGRRRTPTIDLDGEVLVEPTNEAFGNALLRHAELTDEELRERLHIQNIGDLERVVRIATGGVALVAATQAKRGAALPLAAVGIECLLTGVTGWSPLYAAMRVTSIGGPGDRPEEAERRTWLSPA